MAHEIRTYVTGSVVEHNVTGEVATRLNEIVSTAGADPTMRVPTEVRATIAGRLVVVYAHGLVRPCYAGITGGNIKVSVMRPYHIRRARGNLFICGECGRAGR